MTGRDFRRLASYLATLVRTPGQLITVHAATRADVTPLLNGRWRLDVAADFPAQGLKDPTAGSIRRAFWDLRARSEWHDDTAVVWVLPAEGGYHLGLGVLRQAGSPRPALTPVLSVGAEDG